MKKTVLILLAISMLIGCATGPKKVDTVVFYPPPPDTPRLQFLVSISGEDDIGGKRGGFEEFLLGVSVMQKSIGRPYDMGSSSGKIYLNDRTVRGRIIIMDLGSQEFTYLRDPKFGNILANPAGIWVTKDDFKYVADLERKRILVFSKDNRFVKSYGDEDLFDKPVDVTVYEDKVYVCDMKKHKIFVLDKGTGKLRGSIGQGGSGAGQFHRPSHVVVDHLGNIFVTDAFNFRVQMFNSEGQFVKSFGYHGDVKGGFARPKGIGVDREGRLYVVDSAFQNVQIFDNGSGQLLTFFGGGGNAPGRMLVPVAFHIDYDNVEFFSRYADKDFRLKYVVYVGNQWGRNKLNVYGFGEWVGQSFEGEEDEGLEQEK
jgi:DNA-binding beta-propeller fold protein YncE